MSVSLTNKSLTTKVVVLDQEVFLEPRYGFRNTSYSAAERQADGSVRWKTIRRSLPGSLTILPGETSSGLHASIEYNRQVSKMIARGELVLSSDAAPETPQEEPSRATLSSRPRTRGGSFKENGE
jgi:hypothetical protein